MDLIKVVSRNHFLKELYPNGLIEDMLIGRLGLDFGNQFFINFHTKQKPAKDVAKWGVWGENYDVVVICLLGRSVRNITITNWEQISFAPVIWTSHGADKTFLTQRDDWRVLLIFGNLVFQECRTYIGDS